MDFRLTGDQRALKDGTRELLGRLWPAAALREAVNRDAADRDAVHRDAVDRAGLRELWRALGDAGFFALRVPEESGGLGLGTAEAALVFEEAGRALLPGPLVATHLAAGTVPGAASGERVVTRVDGGLVAWLDAADQVLGGAPAGAVALRSVDPLTPLHRVPDPPSGSSSGALAGSGAGSASGVGASEGPASGYHPVAALLTAAEQLGSAGRTTETAVRYAKEREQFGRPVGAFQAVKHLCAGMLVRTEIARSAVYAAAVTGDAAEIAGAKLLADDAAVRNARDCLQVHGGMGFTWEADVHLHLKRAWVRALMRPVAAEAEEIQAETLGTGASR
ncbi:acyl-CoA dehydrogenase family protein [Streptomyces katsurahamanus]|uniref:Acyl-CoA dehydrogenase n=1 Tax=Streptomyces katsurahamanus TaxID=2577098 RepID=A0ABW9NZE8_9ACTN|nr:acyl-CoA dehydrogenase family protein [Streptomyces katsurahamanus]MQS38673.1 acyl-CoA dehydrogenase [Streptomyces katsurahamanus]